jgi:C-terminal processing protease CtpA/Prc
VGSPPTSATFNGANYVQTWLTDEGLPFPPARAAATPDGRGDALADYRGLRLDSLRTVRIPTLVLVNRTSYPALERQLDALQETNRVAVALEARGEPTEEFVLRYTDGIRVRINATMLVNHSGELGSRPDTVVRDSITLQQATLVAERLLSASRRPIRAVSFDYSIHYGAPEPTAQTLTRTQRLYGLFKVETVIDALYPLKDLMSVDWHQMLPHWIQQAEAADSLRAYRTLLSTMASTLNDAHAAATFAIPNRAPATAATIPARLERIKGGVDVAEIEGGQFVTAEGTLSVGDRVLRIDGKAIDSIATESRAIVSASTPGRQDVNLSIQGFLGTLGPINSVARIEIEDSAGVIRTLSVARSHRSNWRPKAAPPARMLPGNIGYVSLSQVNSERALDSLARAFERTDGLIIDARDQRNTIDYDVLSAWLWERPDTIPGSRSRVRIADFRRGQVRLGWSDYKGLFDPRRWRTTSVYTKPIVVLIGPTQSSSQEIIPTRVRDTRRGLLVGAPTAGTNGNATSIALPGGGSFRFTGMRLLNPDGSRFNGIGVQADIRVDRTFEGVRARRDEVLDAGVEALRSLIARGGGGR